jgi:hypothetical protein
MKTLEERVCILDENVLLIETRLEALKQAVETLIHKMDSYDDSNRTQKLLWHKWKRDEE